jgi:hypothetical protein
MSKFAASDGQTTFLEREEDKGGKRRERGEKWEFIKIRNVPNMKI